MATRTYETTNEALQRALNQVAVLVEWADSDAQHAAENDAPGTARDDRRRAKALRRAFALLAECAR